MLRIGPNPSTLPVLSVSPTPPCPGPNPRVTCPINYMFKALVRFTVPTVAFGVGFATFPAQWRRGKWLAPQATHMNPEAVSAIEATPLYKQLAADPHNTMLRDDDHLPSQHRPNYIRLGLLFGPLLFEMDPIVFKNDEKQELVSFYHLGEALVSADGGIHNGVTATILDEGLCICGFAQLPSRRGVTARLTIDFKSEAPAHRAVVLRAKVVEAKGRKVVVDGTLSTFPSDGSEGVEIALARCILVEPRWFRYFRWLQL